jgi:mRNA-degrading endonuclease toxin of MazEF toxin-antitoxin module
VAVAALFPRRPRLHQKFGTAAGVDGNKLTVDSTRPVRTEPPENNLLLPSQVMVDKTHAVQGEKIRRSISHLSDKDMAAVESALGYVLGLAVR